MPPISLTECYIKRRISGIVNALEPHQLGLSRHGIIAAVRFLRGWSAEASHAAVPPRLTCLAAG